MYDNLKEIMMNEVPGNNIENLAVETAKSRAVTLQAIVGGRSKAVSDLKAGAKISFGSPGPLYRQVDLPPYILAEKLTEESRRFLDLGAQPSPADEESQRITILQNRIEKYIFYEQDVLKGSRRTIADTLLDIVSFSDENDDVFFLEEFDYLNAMPEKEQYEEIMGLLEIVMNREKKIILKNRMLGRYTLQITNTP